MKDLDTVESEQEEILEEEKQQGADYSVPEKAKETGKRKFYLGINYLCSDYCTLCNRCSKVCNSKNAGRRGLDEKYAA